MGFQVRELILRGTDWRSFQKVVSHFSNVSAIRLETDLDEHHARRVKTIVQCIHAFISGGKLRSATVSFSGKNLEQLKLWRQKLLQHPDVKIWSKVTRVRCEIVRKC